MYGAVVLVPVITYQTWVVTVIADRDTGEIDYDLTDSYSNYGYRK